MSELVGPVYFPTATPEFYNLLMTSKVPKHNLRSFSLAKNYVQLFTVRRSCVGHSLTEFTKQAEFSLMNSDLSAVLLVSSNNKLLVGFCLSDTDSTTYVKITNKKLLRIIFRLRTELQNFQIRSNTAIQYLSYRKIRNA